MFTPKKRSLLTSNYMGYLKMTQTNQVKKFKYFFHKIMRVFSKLETATILIQYKFPKEPINFSLLSWGKILMEFQTKSCLRDDAILPSKNMILIVLRLMPMYMILMVYTLYKKTLSFYCYFLKKIGYSLKKNYHYLLFDPDIINKYQDI